MASIHRPAVTTGLHFQQRRNLGGRGGAEDVSNTNSACSVLIYWGGGERGGGVWGGPMPFPVLTLTPGLVPRLILTALSLGIGNETSVFNYDSLIYNGPFAF